LALLLGASRFAMAARAARLDEHMMPADLAAKLGHHLAGVFYGREERPPAEPPQAPRPLDDGRPAWSWPGLGALAIDVGDPLENADGSAFERELARAQELADSLVPLARGGHMDPEDDEGDGNRSILPPREEMVLALTAFMDIDRALTERMEAARSLMGLVRIMYRAKLNGEAGGESALSLTAWDAFAWKLFDVCTRPEALGPPANGADSGASSPTAERVEIKAAAAAMLVMISDGLSDQIFFIAARLLRGLRASGDSFIIAVGEFLNAGPEEEFVVGGYLVTRPQTMTGSGTAQHHFAFQCRRLLDQPGLPRRIRQSLINDVLAVLEAADNLSVAEACASALVRMLIRSQDLLLVGDDWWPEVFGRVLRVSKSGKFPEAKVLLRWADMMVELVDSLPEHIRKWARKIIFRDQPEKP